MNKFVPIALAFAVAAAPQAALADPAGDTVNAFHNTLLAAMKSGGNKPARARMIGPAIDRTFDIPLMTRLAVGPSWAGIPGNQQAALIQAFRNLTVNQFAKNFDVYTNERFVMNGIDTRGGDKLVRNTIVSGRTSEPLNYRLRMSGGQWKIIDVYYRNAISQLATRRADFARVLARGGAPALITHLNQLAAR
jgi:phospholipid transport system substrate-binding protein